MINDLPEVTLEKKAERRVERQIFINSDIEVFLSVDPPDKKYTDLVTYLLTPGNYEALNEFIKKKYEEARSADPSMQNNTGSARSALAARHAMEAEAITPVAEILIFLSSSLEYSYEINYCSNAAPGKKAWRRLRDVLESELIRFELDTFGKKGRLSSPGPRVPDEKSISKYRLLMLQYNLYEMLKSCYKPLLERVRAMVKEGQIADEIAAEYELEASVIRRHYKSSTGNRVQPAEVTKAILVGWLENEQMAELLGINSIEQLVDKVLYRDIDEQFPPRG